MKLTLRHSPTRCAYCHDQLVEEAFTCPACGTLVHEDCQLDCCPTLGCASLEPWAWIDLEPPLLEQREEAGDFFWYFVGLLVVLEIVATFAIPQLVPKELTSFEDDSIESTTRLAAPSPGSSPKPPVDPSEVVPPQEAQSKRMTSW